MEAILRGRLRSGRTRGRATALVVSLAVLLLLAVAGCGSQGGKGSSSQGAKTSARAEKSTSGTSKSASGATKAAPGATKSSAARTSAQGAQTTAVPGHVQLRLKGCVEFEPRWSNVAAGQTLTWHNQSSSAITILVAPGAFDRSEYAVPARGVVISGPARKPGDYTISTTPAACQGIPLGVRGTAPGVTVERTKR